MKRLLILLMLVSQPAWAGWVKLGEAPGGPDSLTYYADPTTVRKTPNGRRMWVMYAHGQIQTQSGRAYLSENLLQEFDCSGEKYRILQWAEYSGDMGGGQVVGTSSEPGKWTFVSPGTVANDLLRTACRVPLK